MLDTIESTYRNRVEGLRRRGMPVAAANLEHFLDGSGEPRKLPREEAIKLAPIKEAEATNISRFVNRTFRGDSEKNEIVRQLPSMRLGEGPLHFNDWWERDFEIGNYLWNAALGDRDFAAAIGRVKFRSEGDFQAMRTGDSITISGMVTHRLADTYDFHLWDPGG